AGDDPQSARCEQPGRVRRNGARAARARAELDHDRKNEQNRCRSDQVRMICGVLEQPIHWMCLTRMYRTVGVAGAARSDSITMLPIKACAKKAQSITARHSGTSA